MTPVRGAPPPRGWLDGGSSGTRRGTLWQRTLHLALAGITSMSVAALAQGALPVGEWAQRQQKAARLWDQLEAGRYADVTAQLNRMLLAREESPAGTNEVLLIFRLWTYDSPDEERVVPERLATLNRWGQQAPSALAFTARGSYYISCAWDARATATGAP